jgi:small-conductance mechanosensitive channel
MLFDNVRALGASVLTTAGVVGLVFTLTAQKSLGSILSSLEIAITQPIKIGDTVVINNEFGTVEEINFRSVVVKLWDWRRLVVPTNYFLENIFQNWSREQDNNLIGVVYLFVDFTLPVDKVREELNSILSSNPLWDGTVGTITVNDLQPQVMQLRVLASAKNADDVSKLRNEIREKLMSYIVAHYPNSLPQGRSINIEKAPLEQ